MKNNIVLLVLVGMFKAGDADITGWTEPTIGTDSGSGTLTVPENQAKSTTIETFVATTNASTVTYSLETAGTPFVVASNGELTITAALDFEATPTYTLEIKAVDDAGTPGSGTATITVTVTDVSEAPTFAKTTFATTIADNSTAGTTVFTATATDKDSGDIIMYSIAADDTNSHFAIAPSTGVITVNTGVTLVACTAYALQIEAVDNETPPKTGTATLNIEVTPCSGATMIAVSTTLILFATLLTILQ